MATTTARLALPRPEAADADNVPGDLTALTDRLELVVVDRRGGDTITASGAAVIPLVVKGTTGQTANLLEARDSAGTVLTSVSAGGQVGIGAAPLNLANIYSVARTASHRGLIVQAAASQTANLAEFQDSAGAVLGGRTSTGRLILNSTDHATTATAGGAGSVPTVADRFLNVQFADGSVRKIACFLP